MTRPSSNGRNGRDASGRFAKGNPGGPGNPFARRVAAIRSALLDAVDDGGIGEVAQGLLQAAKAGDVAAAKLLLSYTIGQPMAVTNPDRLDLDERYLTREIQDADESDRLTELIRGSSAA